MIRKSILVLLGACALLNFISCTQNVDNNVYVRTASDFNELVKDVEWDIKTVPAGKATFNTQTNILTITSTAAGSMGDDFAYFFRDGRLTLRDIDSNGDYKALNNATTRVTLINCSHDITGSLKSYDLGLHDLGINLSRTGKEGELNFENNFATGWNAVNEETGKTATVSINAATNEITFMVEGGTNPTVVNYEIKESVDSKVVIILTNIDYTSDFYFKPGEITYNPLLPNEEIELCNAPKVLLKKAGVTQ